MISSSHWKVCLCFAVLVFMVAAVPGTSLAGDEEYEGKGVILKEGVDYPIPIRGTGQFAGTGRIDSVDMENQTMAIDDATYFLNQSTEYYTSTLRPGSIQLFREGQAVGFVATRDKEILSLWLVD